MLAESSVSLNDLLQRRFHRGRRLLRHFEHDLAVFAEAGALEDLRSARFFLRNSNQSRRHLGFREHQRSIAAPFGDEREMHPLRLGRFDIRGQFRIHIVRHDANPPKAKARARIDILQTNGGHGLQLLPRENGHFRFIPISKAAVNRAGSSIVAQIVDSCPTIR